MDELSAMLGELSDCLGDDVAPAQIEADQQNRAILKRRAKLQRVLTQNPQLAEELAAELGFLGKAFKAIGKGLTAPLRVTGKLVTGDFKGALKSAADPMGLSTLARKGKNTVKDIRGVIKAPAKLAGKVAGSLAAKTGLSTGLRLPVTTKPFIAPPALQMKCTPCNPEIAKAITTKVVPEMQKVQKLLDKMELSRKATSEHKKKQQQRKWRKQVLVLLKRIQQKRCA